MKIDSVTFGATAPVKIKNFALSVFRIRGMKVGVNDRWLQVFDTYTTPAAAAVPKRSYLVNASAPFDIFLEQAPLDFKQGCYIALSSTRNTYTANGDSFDLFVTGESHIDDTGWVEVGDITSADNNLEIFAAPTSKKLVRLQAFDILNDANCYVCLQQGQNFLGNEVIPAGRAFFLATGGYIDIRFGDGIPSTTGFHCGTSLLPNPFDIASDVAIVGTYKL